MKIQRKCNLTNAIISLLALFAICYLANTYSNFTVYGQLSQNASDNNTNQMLNTNTTQNVTDSNTKNAIPYVLNVTNSSDATSQAVDQVIQAVGGGQSTLKEVIDAILAATWKVAVPQNAYPRAIQRSVQVVAVQKLIALAGDENASPLVRAEASGALRSLSALLKTTVNTGKACLADA